MKETYSFNLWMSKTNTKYVISLSHLQYLTKNLIFLQPLTYCASILNDWQNCGCFSHLPVKVATLLSASLHLLSFHSCSDLHNLSHHSQDLLLKYVCTDRCRYAHTEKRQQQCMTGSLYCCHKPNADLRSLQLSGLRGRQPDRQSPFLIPFIFAAAFKAV